MRDIIRRAEHGSGSEAFSLFVAEDRSKWIQGRPRPLFWRSVDETRQRIAPVKELRAADRLKSRAVLKAAPARSG
jgi:hypothetical protein